MKKAPSCDLSRLSPAAQARNRIFADKHKFASLAAAQEYAESVLRKLNDDEAFDTEKCALLPSQSFVLRLQSPVARRAGASTLTA